jgi:peroxiredoxin
MKLLLTTFLLAVTALAASAQAPRAALKVGDKAPDIALPNGDGKLVQLADYTARAPVVIVFYRGFW